MIDVHPYSIQWANNPEPDKQALTGDSQIILDTETPTSDGYLWDSKNCQEGWLSYSGELAELIR